MSIPDNSRPARGFRSDELREFLRARRCNLNDQIAEALLDVRGSQNRSEIRVHFLQNRTGCAARRAEPIPGIHFEVGKHRLVHVGTEGSCGMRLRLVTASARTRPLSIAESTPGADCTVHGI
jgi:hypothetical protein